MRAAVVLALTTAILTACAAERPASDRTLASAAPAGESRACLDPRQVISRRPAGPRTVFFEVAGGTTYRNDLPDPCPGLARRNAGDAFRFDIRDGDQICRDTRFRVFDPVEAKGVGTEAFPVCRLGAFTPVATDRRGAAGR